MVPSSSIKYPIYINANSEEVDFENCASLNLMQKATQILHFYGF